MNNETNNIDSTVSDTAPAAGNTIFKKNKTKVTPPPMDETDNTDQIAEQAAADPEMQALAADTFDDEPATDEGFDEIPAPEPDDSQDMASQDPGIEGGEAQILPASRPRKRAPSAARKPTPEIVTPVETKGPPTPKPAPVTPTLIPVPETAADKKATGKIANALATITETASSSNAAALVATSAAGSFLKSARAKLPGMDVSQIAEVYHNVQGLEEKSWPVLCAAIYYADLNMKAVWAAANNGRKGTPVQIRTQVVQALKDAGCTNISVSAMYSQADVYRTFFPIDGEDQGYNDPDADPVEDENGDMTIPKLPFDIEAVLEALPGKTYYREALNTPCPKGTIVMMMDKYLAKNGSYSTRDAAADCALLRSGLSLGRVHAGNLTEDEINAAKPKRQTKDRPVKDGVSDTTFRGKYTQDIADKMVALSAAEMKLAKMEAPAPGKRINLYIHRSTVDRRWIVSDTPPAESDFDKIISKTKAFVSIDIVSKDHTGEIFVDGGISLRSGFQIAPKPDVAPKSEE